ncbi:MAG: PEP-CTERM sorting domain-containing protein [Myxococcota bacterium]
MQSTIKTVAESPTTVPSSGSLLSTDGVAIQASSDVGYSMGEGGFSTSFAFDLPSQPGSYTAFFQDVYFSVSEDQSYAFSGAFDSDHSGPGRTTMDVLLYDVTTGTELFHNRQSSLSTQNESFAVGGVGADWVNELSGGLSGVLVAGREYQLKQFALVNNGPGGGGYTSATASGTFAVTFSAVPEPSTAALFAFGLISLARLSRRR